MRFIPVLLLLALAGASLAQDTDRPPRITSATVTRDDITLVFDQAMVTWSATPSVSALHVTPAKPCLWNWEDATTLQCSLALDRERGDDFPAATPFRIDIGEGLWSQSGQAVPRQSITLESGRPQAGLSARAWEGGRPALRIDSGSRLREEDLRAVLRVRVDGREVGFRFEDETSDWDTGIEWTLHPDWPADAKALEVELLPGLRSPEGPLPGTKGWTKRYQLDEPFAFAGYACSLWDVPAKDEGAGACPPGSPGYLLFTARPDAASMTGLREALPEGLSLADTEEEYCGRCERPVLPPLVAIALRSDVGGRAFHWQPPAGLRDTRGRTMAPAAPVRFELGDFPASLAFEPESLVQRPGTGTVPRVSARNLEVDGPWVDFSIGRQVRRTTRRVDFEGEPNVGYSPELPAPSRELLRHGGLLVSGATGLPWQTRTMGVAPFHALVRRAPGTPDAPGALLAWATEWDDAAPVADVQAEWLVVSADGRAESLARGSGGPDGVVTLATGMLPEAQRDRLQVLRLRSGRRTVVVPLNGVADYDAVENHRAPERGPVWRGVSMDLRFGLTDRLLYRPGETVRYRVWLRSRDDATLRTPDAGSEVPMVLDGAYWSDSVISDWTDRVDDWGSVTGERRLPASLEDGTYCIVPGDPDDGRYGRPEGACFEVARFDAQALWASLSTPRPVLRAGETVVMNAEAGFYSGGAAAGLPMGWMGLGQPADFTEAYPAFSDFSFVAGDTRAESDPLRGVAVPRVLDAQGRAVLRWDVEAQRDLDRETEAPMPFARVQVNATVGLLGQAQASSPTATVFVAAHARYVGLRITRDWNVGDAGPVLEAVVVGHDGVAAPGVPVEVSIRRGDEEAVLARCRLAAGQPGDCAFRAARPGLYHLDASAGDAAGTSLSVFVWGDGGEEAGDAPLVRLEAVPGEPGQVRLRQPHARARVLLMVEREALRAHRVLEVGPESVIALPADPQADGAPVVAVRALIRPIIQPTPGGDLPATLDATLRLPRDVASPAPPELLIAQETMAPGGTLVVGLRNNATQARAFTLAVVDEGMHQQAAGLHARQDPADGHFLGGLAEWRSASWFATEGWRGSIHGTLIGLVDPEASFRRSGVPRVVSAAQVNGDSTTLDSIEVTGSRIRRSDIFEAQLGRGPRAIAGFGGAAPRARVRTRFADTAYWNDGLVLAPGETRTLEITLPDNLTRWRVQAWAMGQGGDFARAERTVTATLPVEVRLGLPAHLYPGDRSHGAINARLADGEARPLEVAGQARGAGVASAARREARVAANASLAASLPLAPGEHGAIDVLGEGRAGDDQDAVAGEVPVLSRWATSRVSQLAWLTSEALDLRSPGLPAGARDAQLAVTVGDGLATLRREWLEGLRDYPHRCWEQTLSRSLGAALALADAQDAARWPEAAQVIEDAYAAAPRFIDWNGEYRFFDGPGSGQGELMLTAHTVRGLLQLAALGHEPPPELLEEAVATLDSGLDELVGRVGPTAGGRLRGSDREVFVLVLAALAAAGEDVDEDHVRAAWRDWDALSWQARAELAGLLSRQPAMADAAAEALARLRAAGTPRGARRVIEEIRDFSAVMGSNLRDQCAVVATLLRLDPIARRDGSTDALLRGIVDQYAGGSPMLDTQAALHCLLALREARAAAPEPAVAFSGLVLRAGEDALALAPLPGGEGQGWSGALPAGSLRVDAATGLPALAMLRADASYQEDQANTQAAGTGMVLGRRYAVLRDGRWQVDIAPREGEWVKVTLQLQVPAWRNFIAITDPVPGGWTPRDTSLAGVGAAALSAGGNDDSHWFDSRQTGTTHVRLYARRLPPGVHAVSYLAQATHAGEFLAPPAVAEVMYGGGSRANTAADRVRVLPAR